MADTSVEVQVALVPYGLMEGTPCYRVSAMEGFQEGELAEALRSSRRVGVSTIYFEAAPWGDQDWTKEIAIAASRGFGSMTYATRLPLNVSRWPQVDMHVIGDASYMLTDHLSDDAAVQALAGRPFHPALQELVVVSPHLDNLRAGLLDRVYEEVGPEMSACVYLPRTPPTIARAISAVTRCHSTWTVRGQ